MDLRNCARQEPSGVAFVLQAGMFTEWKTLIDAVGGINVVSTALKHSSAWKIKIDDEYVMKNNSTDDYGFSLIPSGYRNAPNGFFCSGSEVARLWSANESRSESAYFYAFMLQNSIMSGAK